METVPGSRACTLIQTMNEVLPFERVNERATLIAQALKDMRRGVVVFDPTPKELTVAGSTPFNLEGTI